MKYRQAKESKPIPVLLDKALRDRIEAVSQKMGEPKSTVMRIAMRIGLEGLDKAFKLAAAKTLANLSYPEYKDQATAMNEGKDANSSTEVDEGDLIDRLREEAGEKPAPKKKRGAHQKSKQSPSA